MTISSITRKAGPYIGNGTASTFPFTFKVFAQGDLRVVRLNVATNVETTLTLTTDYTVTLNADQNANPGGSVTLVAGALATGFNLVMTSNVSNLQPTDLTNQGGFYPDVITDALDRATIQIQQLQESVNRAAVLPITSTISTDQLVADIINVAGHTTELSTVASNIADITATAAHMTEIVAAPGYASSAAADAALALSYKNAANTAKTAAEAASTSASGSASAASASAVTAAAAVAAAGIPNNLAGRAKQFLQVKTDESGYELVTSVAAPAFFGFKLSDDLLSLNMTYGRDDYNVDDFSTWTMSENVTFQIVNNSLKMVLL